MRFISGFGDNTCLSDTFITGFWWFWGIFNQLNIENCIHCPFVRSLNQTRKHAVDGTPSAYDAAGFVLWWIKCSNNNSGIYLTFKAPLDYSSDQRQKHLLLLWGSAEDKPPVISPSKRLRGWSQNVKWFPVQLKLKAKRCSGMLWMKITLRQELTCWN